jgi:hypothetical protein
MTKKDYELIASVYAEDIKFHDGDNTTSIIMTNACLMANALQLANPRFNREKFLKGCGVTE